MANNILNVEDSPTGASRSGFGLLPKLPFPIAYPCRQVLALKETGNRDQLARLQGALVEIILGYLACVSLALVPDDARHKLALNPKELWKPGMTGGKWRKVIQAACEQLPSGATTCGDRIKQLRIGQNQRDFGKLAAGLVSTRNDYHHVAFSDSCTENFTQLGDLLSYLEFLADHQLVRVEGETRNRGANRVLSVDNLMGDHPAHLKARMEWPDLNSHFNADDAYVIVDGKAYELFPFVIIQHCAKHDRNELCFLDKITGEGVRYLSFEDREEHSSQDGAQDIYDWFAGKQVMVEGLAESPGQSSPLLPGDSFVAVGEEVIVSDGELASQRGQVEDIDESDGFARVSFNVLGEVVPIQLRLTDLARPAKPRRRKTKEQNLTELILAVLVDSGRPLRPKEIAASILARTGQPHDKSDISRWISDSSILQARLRQDDQYRWFLVVEE